MMQHQHQPQSPTNILGDLDIQQMPLSYRKLHDKLPNDPDLQNLGHEIQAMQVQVVEARLLYQALVSKNNHTVRMILDAVKPLLR
jgi:hypothetical protein